VDPEEFAHGYHYGDYGGVEFYGPPRDGLWLDRLAVSDTYLDSLFRAVLDRAWSESGGERTPRLADDWNALTGWCDCAAGRVSVPAGQARELVAALGWLTTAALAPHCAGCTPGDCLRCAAAIVEFVGNRLEFGASICMEQE
jgi:hypothetical protein